MKPEYFLIIPLFLSGHFLNAQIFVKPGACKIIIDGIRFNKEHPVDTLKYIKEGKLSVYNSLNNTCTSIKEGQIYYTARTMAPVRYAIMNGKISPDLINIMWSHLGNDDILLFKELYYKNGSMRAKFSDILWEIKK